MRRFVLPVIFWILLLFLGRGKIADSLSNFYERYGVAAAEAVTEKMLPAVLREEGKRPAELFLEANYPVSGYFPDPGKKDNGDSCYRRFLAEKRRQEKKSRKPEEIMIPETEAAEEVETPVLETEKENFDTVIRKYYSIHPTTKAGPEIIDPERFLKMDFSIEKTDSPQILIYHTHSQEEFSDHDENPEATVVGAGNLLTELLTEKGYRVIHDTTSYDMSEGKLDRNRAYTYALEGITGILSENPSIEVVIDLHRDGVREGTRLVTEIDGRKTAKIMFFNGLSETPDGPVPYLPNPNRDRNLGFSFQLQKAAEKYPGLTRKIYLKGLRYNEHVRERAILIEAGAQTNTYEEVRNAMIPLADIFDEVLSP